MAPVRVAVVGAGISGLAAARELLRALPDAEVLVLEGSPRPGGKLRTGDLGGLPVEDGVESLLARDPAAVDLVRALGLADRLEAPRTTGASVWSRGAPRPLPGGTVLGLPADLRTLARSRVLSARGLLRVTADVALPGAPVGADVAVGALVARRMGREVVDRLLDPLLGGVYAGRADALSLDATVPRLAAAARRHRSLLRAAREARPPASTAAGPVFVGLRGGFGALVDALAADVAARGGALRTRATVRALDRAGSPGARWRLEVGSAASPEHLEVDAVVLAVPPAPAARLLRRAAPVAAAELAGVETASIALVTLAFPRGALSPPPGSGLLVPAVEGRSVKAVTFSTRKWDHVDRSAPDLEVVRASLGRAGEEALLARDDTALAELVRADLTDLAGARGQPVAARVVRWGGALPQYAVGHRDRVARIRRDLADAGTLRACGATYDGVGVPACVRSGQTAAQEVVAALRTAPSPPPSGSATLDG